MPTVIAYISTLVALAGLDFLWIGVFMKDFYQESLAPYIAKNFNLPAAGLLYLIYTAGILYFAILPSGTWVSATWRGAFLGFVAYSLYDLTNIVTFSSWPLELGIIDIVWGTILTAVAAGIGFAAMQYLVTN